MNRLNRLTERLREMHTIRRNTTPLSVAIGLAQEAADELDRLQARVAELETLLEQKQEQYDSLLADWREHEH